MRSSTQRSFRIRHIWSGALIGVILGGLVGIITSIPDEIFFVPPMIRGIIIGGILGASIHMYEEFLFQSKFRRKSYLFLLINRKVIYVLTFSFWLILVNTISAMIEYNVSLMRALESTVIEGTFIRDIIIVAVLTLFIISFMQIQRLHNKGDLFNFITGKYSKPSETERIFFFLDLKSSTTIAEKLGNIKYSNFLIDYYYDITEAILNSRAEIYQYVGDEIVLTWPFERGIQDANCINCYFDIRNIFRFLKDKYLSEYGVYPEFKAAVHGGKVVITWIGDIKKEIVFHGDVLNTAKKMQEKCEELRQSFLISHFLMDKIELPSYCKSEFAGEIPLRGKADLVNLYGLKLITDE
jgi:adenylate cyclase